MSPKTVYLITGASRGIGLGVVAELLAQHSGKDDIGIVAAVRDPENVPTLKELAAAHPHAVLIVKYVSGDLENNKSIATQAEAYFGGLDVVVANAGISKYLGSVAETPADTFREHFEVNAMGPLVLFQAVQATLQKSANPKFIGMGSIAGSLSFYMEAPIGKFCYGSSKAVLNYMLRKIHFENEWLTAFPLSPGIIVTDLSKENVALDNTGTYEGILKSHAIEMNIGAPLLVGIIKSCTRATHGGEYINIDGTKVPW